MRYHCLAGRPTLTKFRALSLPGKPHPKRIAVDDRHHALRNVRVVSTDQEPSYLVHSPFTGAYTIVAI